MAEASPPTAIAELRRWLERRESDVAGPADVLPFGIPDIDERLPGGGLQRGHLHEVIEGGAAGEFAAIATLFTAGIVARLLAMVADHRAADGIKKLAR